jgi:hypothetical protein
MFQNQDEQLKQELFDLRLEHGGLNELIDRMIDDPTVDQLQLRRLKKRKLQLKDAIRKLESKLIPDMDA